MPASGDYNTFNPQQADWTQDPTKASTLDAGVWGGTTGENPYVQPGLTGATDISYPGVSDWNKQTRVTPLPQPTWGSTQSSGSAANTKPDLSKYSANGSFNWAQWLKDYQAANPQWNDRGYGQQDLAPAVQPGWNPYSAMLTDEAKAARQDARAERLAGIGGGYSGNVLQGEPNPNADMTTGRDLAVQAGQAKNPYGLRPDVLNPQYDAQGNLTGFGNVVGGQKVDEGMTGFEKAMLGLILASIGMAIGGVGAGAGAVGSTGSTVAGTEGLQSLYGPLGAMGSGEAVGGTVGAGGILGSGIGASPETAYLGAYAPAAEEAVAGTEGLQSLFGPLGAMGGGDTAATAGLAGLGTDAWTQAGIDAASGGAGSGVSNELANYLATGNLAGGDAGLGTLGAAGIEGMAPQSGLQSWLQKIGVLGKTGGFNPAGTAKLGSGILSALSTLRGYQQMKDAANQRLQMGMNAGSASNITNQLNSIFGSSPQGAALGNQLLQLLQHPGQLSPAAYERGQEQANQTTQAMQQAANVRLGASGWGANSGMNKAMQEAAAAQGGVLRNQANRDFTMLQEQLKRQDIQQASQAYLGLLNDLTNMANIQANAAAQWPWQSQGAPAMAAGGSLANLLQMLGLGQGQ